MWKLLSLDDPAWDGILARIGVSDPYFSRNWHAAASLAMGGGQAEMFTYEEDDHVFAICAIRRAVDIQEGTFDLETAYGYGGPVSSTADGSFLARAWAARDAWAQSVNVVAEFRRFHPILGNETLAEPGCVTRFDRPTVIMKIMESEEKQIKSYKSNARRNVRKSLREHVTVSEDFNAERLSQFINLYNRTMERIGANKFYFFSREYFETLIESPSVKIFTARLGETVLAMSIVLVGDKAVHYHLGANDERYFHTRPMNALFHGIARWAAERGLREFHLGGGRTSYPDDELFRFKASMSEQRGRFFTGTRVFQDKLYQRLKQQVFLESQDERALAYALPWRLS